MTATGTGATTSLAEQTTRSAATTRLVDGALDMVRLFHALKSAQGPSARHLLHVVRRFGPLRQSALAEHVHTDPSTVSRHVAELVGDGLVQRQADPDDGRASLLALTAAGVVAVDAMREARDARIAAALDGWSTAQIDALGEGIDRLTASVTTLTAPRGTHDHPTTEGRP